MNPVFPNHTRFERALAAARIRLATDKDRCQLSSESIDEICAELLDFAAELERSQSHADIEPGRHLLTEPELLKTVIGPIEVNPDTGELEQLSVTLVDWSKDCPHPVFRLCDGVFYCSHCGAGLKLGEPK